MNDNWKRLLFSDAVRVTSLAMLGVERVNARIARSIDRAGRMRKGEDGGAMIMTLLVALAKGAECMGGG
jgi:hypothetical protein